MQNVFQVHNKKIPWKRILLFSFLVLLINLLFFFLLKTDVVKTVENMFYDFFVKKNVQLKKTFKNKMFSNIPTESPVVIIAIDDASIVNSRFAVPPINHHYYYAKILKSLSDAGAKVVTIDAILIDTNNDLELNIPEKELDEWFEVVSAIRQDGNTSIISGMRWIKDQAIWPDAKYMEALGVENFGFLNFVVDKDGVLRRQVLYLDNKDTLFGHYCLAYLTAKAYDSSFVMPEDNVLPINFFAKYNGFQQYSFLDVYQKSRANELEFFKENFENKIVLIGGINSLNIDTYSTPLGSQVGEKTEIFQSDYAMSSVLASAYLVDTLLSKKKIKFFSSNEKMLLIGFLSFILLLPILFTKMHGTYPFTYLPLFLLIIFFFIIFLFLEYNIFLPVFGFFILLLFFQALYIILKVWENNLLKVISQEALGYYINPVLAGEIVKNPDFLMRGGVRERLTIFFSDLVGFTAWAEQIPPEELVSILNKYYEYMSQCILSFGGSIDKYEGDSIMAFWGAPKPSKDHAIMACLSALEQVKIINKINESFKKENKKPLNVLIGINTGSVIVGNMGAAVRFSYTVLGDAVNLASRLVAVNKIYGTSIAISSHTAEEVKDKVVVRELDKVRVLGRQEPLVVYEVFCGYEDLTEKKIKVLNLFSRALNDYYNDDFAKALVAFETVLEFLPNDGPSKVFVSRCRNFIRNGVPKNWDGISDVSIK